MARITKAVLFTMAIFLFAFILCGLVEYGGAIGQTTVLAMMFILTVAALV